MERGRPEKEYHPFHRLCCIAWHLCRMRRAKHILPKAEERAHVRTYKTKDTNHLRRSHTRAIYLYTESQLSNHAVWRDNLLMFSRKALKRGVHQRFVIHLASVCCGMWNAAHRACAQIMQIACSGMLSVGFGRLSLTCMQFFLLRL